MNVKVWNSFNSISEQFFSQKMNAIRTFLWYSFMAFNKVSENILSIKIEIKLILTLINGINNWLFSSWQVNIASPTGICAKGAEGGTVKYLCNLRNKSSTFSSWSFGNKDWYPWSNSDKCFDMLQLPNGTMYTRVKDNHSEGLLERSSTYGRTNQPISVSPPMRSIFINDPGLAQLLQLEQNRLMYFLINLTYCSNTITFACIPHLKHKPNHQSVKSKHQLKYLEISDRWLYLCYPPLAQVHKLYFKCLW